MASPFRKSAWEVTTGSDPVERPDPVQAGRSHASRRQIEEAGPVALVNPRPALSAFEARQLSDGQAVEVTDGGTSVNAIVVGNEVIVEEEPLDEYLEQPFYSEPAIEAPQLDLTPPAPGPEYLAPEPEIAPAPYNPPEPVSYVPPAPPVETAPTAPTGGVTYTSEYGGTITVRDAEGNVIGYLDSNTMEPL